jgi:AcrR family transcriptional regulator
MPSELRQSRDHERTRRRRESLLDAAARVFVRQGYHRTLISDIAAEARVGQGTFYRHFPEKRAVFQAVLDRFTGSLLDEFAGMSARPPRDASEYRKGSIDAIRRVAAALERNRDLAQMLFREAPTVDSELEERVAGFHEAFVGLAQSFLDHAVASGFARPCRTRVVAHAIVGMGVSMAGSWWAGRLSDLAIDGLIEELVDFAFDGIRKIPRDSAERFQ